MGPRFTDALVARYMGASSPSADELSSPERPRSRSAVVSSSSKPGDHARLSAPRTTVASLPRATRTGKGSDSSRDELQHHPKTGAARSSSAAENQVPPRLSNSSTSAAALKGSAALGDRAAQLLAKHHARLQGLVPDASAAASTAQGHLSSSGPATRSSLRTSDAATGGSSNSPAAGAASSLQGSAAAHLQRISEGSSTEPLQRRVSASTAAAMQGARRASGDPTTTTATAAAPRPPRVSNSQQSPSPRPTPHFRPSTTTAAPARASSSGGGGPAHSPGAAAGGYGDSSDEEAPAVGGAASKLRKQQQQQERRGSWQGPASPGSPNLPPPDPQLVKQAVAISRSRAKGQARLAVRAASDDGRDRSSGTSSEEGSEGGGGGKARRSRGASSSSGEDAALRKMAGYGDGTRRPPPPPPEPPAAPAAAGAAEAAVAPGPPEAAAPGPRSSAAGAGAAGSRDRQGSSGGGAVAAAAASSGREDLEQELLWQQVQASARPERTLSPSSGAGSPRRRGSRCPPEASSSRWTPWYQDHVRHLQTAQGRAVGDSSSWLHRGGLDSDVSFHEWRSAGAGATPGTGHKLLRRLLREGLSRAPGSSSSSAGDESGDAEDAAGGNRRGRGRLVGSSKRSRDRSRSPGPTLGPAGLNSQRWMQQQAQAALMRASLQAVAAASGRAPPGEHHHRERVRAVLGDATNTPRQGATSRGRGGRAGSPLKGRSGSPSKLVGVEDLLPGPSGGSRYGYGSSSSAASRGRAAAAAAGGARSRSSSPVLRPRSAMAGLGLPGVRPSTSASRPGRYPSAPSYRSSSPSARRAAGARSRGGLLAELGQLRDARSSRELMPPPRPRSARPVSPPKGAHLTGLTDNVSPPSSAFWSTSYQPQSARAASPASRHVGRLPSPVGGLRAGTPVSPIHHLSQVLPAEDLLQWVGERPNISPQRPRSDEGRPAGMQQQYVGSGMEEGLGAEAAVSRARAESPVQPLLHIPRSLTNVEGRADLQLISSPPRSRPQAAANLAALEHLAAANVLLQPQYTGVRGRRGQDPRRPQLLPVQELEESFAAWKSSRGAGAAEGGGRGEVMGVDSMSPDRMLLQQQQHQQEFMGWLPSALTGLGRGVRQQQGFYAAASSSSLVPEPSLDFGLPPLPPTTSPPLRTSLPHISQQQQRQQAEVGLLPSHLQVTEDGDVIQAGQQQAVQKQLSAQGRTEHLERLSQELAAQQVLVQQQLDAALKDQVQELQGYGYLAPAAAARSPGSSRPGTAAAARAAVQPGVQPAAGGVSARGGSGELGVSLEVALRSVQDLDEMMGALLVNAAARSPTGHRDSLIASTAAAAAAAAAAAVQEEEQGAAYDGSSFGQQLAAAAAATEAAVRAVTPGRPSTAAALVPPAASSGSPVVQRQLFGSTAVSPSNMLQQQQAGVVPLAAHAQRSSPAASPAPTAAAAVSSQASGADANSAVLAKLAAIEAQLQYLQNQQQQAAGGGMPLQGFQQGASSAAAAAMGGMGLAASPRPSASLPGTGGSPLPTAAAAAAAMGYSPPAAGPSRASSPMGAAGGGWSTPPPGAGAATSSTPEMASTRRAVGDLQQLMAQMSHLQASVQGLQLGQGSPALVSKVAALLSSPGPRGGMGLAPGGAGASSLLGGVTGPAPAAAAAAAAAGVYLPFTGAGTAGEPSTEASAASLAAIGALLGVGRPASPALLQQQASATSSSWRSGAVSRSLPTMNLFQPDQQQQQQPSWQGVLASGAAGVAGGGDSSGLTAAMPVGSGTSPLGGILLSQALQEAQEAQQLLLQERVQPLEKQVWEQGQLLGRLEQVLARQQLHQSELGPLAQQQHQQLVTAVQEQQQRQQQELGNHAQVLQSVQEVVQGLLVRLQALHEQRQSDASSLAAVQAQQLAMQVKQQGLQQLEQQLAAALQQQQQQQADRGLEAPAAAAITEALQRLEGRVQQLQQQAAQQQQALEQEVQQRQAAQEVLQGQGEEAQGQQQQVVVLERLAAMEQQQAHQQQQLQKVAAQWGTIEQQVAASQQQLEEQVQGAATSASAAWQAPQQQAQRVEEVAASLASHQEQQQEAAGALQQASAGVQLLQEQLAGLEAKVSQLQLSVLTTGQDSPAVAAGAGGDAGSGTLAKQQQAQLEGLQQQVSGLQQQLAGVQQQQQQQLSAPASAAAPGAEPVSSEVAVAVEALGARVSALAGQLQEVSTTTAVNLPLRLSEVEQRVMSTAQTCADAVKVIAFKHQAISEMFTTMQAAQAGLDSRLQQLEAELARARAARRSSSRPSSSQEGAAAVPLVS